MILTVYVDDVFMTAACDEFFTIVVDSFKRRFEARQSDVLDKHLGFSVEDTDNEVMLHNAPMTERLLRHIKIEFCKPVWTPLPLRLDLCGTDVRSLPDTTLCREFVGSLLKFANTVRSDIAFLVGYLSRFMNHPTEGLWRTASKFCDI